MSRVAVVRCESYERARVDEAVARLFELLGGAARFARPAETLLLKPNLLKSAPPGSAVATHPEVLRAVVGSLHAAAPGLALRVGDSPAWGGFESAAEAAGLATVCRETGAALTPFTGGVKAPNPRGQVYDHLVIAREALDRDGLINLPKLKTHCQLYMTGAVKNLFGCVAGKRKAWWHFKAGNFENYFPLMLVETARLLDARLHLLDAVLAMEGNGPGSGTPRRAGLLLASEDPVALDRVACEIAGLDPARLRTLEAARALGWGETDLAKIEIAGLPLAQARLARPLEEPKMMPIGFSLPRVVKSTLKQQWLLRAGEPLHRIS
ncbi:MAG: DUF362 domain-containing protein [Candidatus Tectomicrobia bacterium]|nr:DUF362 domain-containing protein [Candidatus Tectomicrobia bacterium]